jgi:4-hydroxy-tetrahydrodipicolinate synthase
VSDTPDDFQIYSGNDADTLPWLAVGAVGVIAVASHVVGPSMSEMISLFKAGDAAAAAKIHLDLMEVFDLMGLTTNPIPVKAAMAELGFSVGSPRLPLIDLTPEQLKILKETLGRHGVL